MGMCACQRLPDSVASCQRLRAHVSECERAPALAIVSARGPHANGCERLPGRAVRARRWCDEVYMTKSGKPLR